MDVSLPLPTEEVGVALTLTLTTTVEEQNAVAVPREQLRPLLRGCAPGEGDNRPRVVHSLSTAKYAEEADEERGRPASPGSEAPVEHAYRDEHGEWDESADEVVAGRRPRVRLQEVVVHHVQRNGADRKPGERDLASHSCGDTSRERRSGWWFGMKGGVHGFLFE